MPLGVTSDWEGRGLVRESLPAPPMNWFEPEFLESSGNIKGGGGGRRPLPPTEWCGLFRVFVSNDSTFLFKRTNTIFVFK